MRVAARDCVWRQDRRLCLGGSWALREVHNADNDASKHRSGNCSAVVIAGFGRRLTAGIRLRCSGGVYIGSAQVYVGPRAGNSGQPYAVPDAAYVPSYGPPAYALGMMCRPPLTGRAMHRVRCAGYYLCAGLCTTSAYSAPPVAVYGARPTVGTRAYVSPYAAGFAPRPPAVVPYGNGGRCVVSNGRVFWN